MPRHRVLIEFGDANRHPGEYIGRVEQFARDDAARLLRGLRLRGGYIEARADSNFYVEEPPCGHESYRIGGPEHPAIARAISECM